MKTITKIVSIFLAALCIAGCVVDGETISDSSSSSSSNKSVITAVTISGASAISYNADTTLTAAVTTEDNSKPTISYTWTITGGTAYAYFGTAGTTTKTTTTNTVSFTANNTTSSAQTVSVTVTATNTSNTADKATSEAFSISIAKQGETVKDALTAVSLSANAESISATSKATLTATPTYTGNPSITYTWTITNGEDYAYFTSEGEGSTKKTRVDDADCKITGNNTTESDQSVTIQVVATDGEGNTANDSVTITVLAPATDTDTLYLNLTNGQVSPDNSKWYDISTSKTNFSGDTISVKYTKDSGESTGLIKIDATEYANPLTVHITGTMTTGGVKIQSNGSDTVTVNLNGAVITSSNYPCVEVTKGSPTVVVLTGTNIFTDERTYGTGYGEEYSTSSSDTYTDDDGNTVACTVVKSAQREGSDSKGTLYSKGNLTISGSGSLKVTQGYKNCIASKSILTIESGTYTLTSTGKNGLFADESVVVNGGMITFSGTGTVSTTALRKTNGIKADSDNSNSTVYIKGGTINLTAYNGKGIAASKVYISGGSNTITVTGTSGYTNDDRKTGYYYTADGEKVTCTGGTSGYITCAPEGIEGDTVVEISGGTTEVYAQDDGVNVSSSSANFTMKDGYLYVYATKGDGIDSNGTLTVSGGVIVSYAPTGSEDALDSDGKTYIYGGVIAGVCGSTMGLSEYSTSGQKVLYFTGSSSSGMGGMRAAPSMGGPGSSGGPGQSGGSSSSSSSSFSKVAVAVGGTVKYAFTLPSSSFGLCVLSCPSFTSSASSSYTVYTSPTFSGGTDFHGLYASDASETTLPTITTGNATSTPSIK